LKLAIGFWQEDLNGSFSSAGWITLKFEQLPFLPGGSRLADPIFLLRGARSVPIARNPGRKPAVSRLPVAAAGVQRIAFTAR
jgi:hypothetical protein